MEKLTLTRIVSLALLTGLVVAAQSVLRKPRPGWLPAVSEDAIHGRPFPSSQINKWWV